MKLRGSYVEVTVLAFKFRVTYAVETCVRLISMFQTSENSGQTHIFFTNAGKARLTLGNTTKQQLQFPCLAAASTTFFPLMVSIDCPMNGLLFSIVSKRKWRPHAGPDRHQELATNFVSEEDHIAE